MAGNNAIYGGGQIDLYAKFGGYEAYTKYLSNRKNDHEIGDGQEIHKSVEPQSESAKTAAATSDEQIVTVTSTHSADANFKGTEQKAVVGNGSLTGIKLDLSDMYKQGIGLRLQAPPVGYDPGDGKYFVPNIESEPKHVEANPGGHDKDGYYTHPSDSNWDYLYQQGYGTHGFLNASTDFLREAAEKYATLADNEKFQFRGIDDREFVDRALRFFQGESYTEEDVTALRSQMKLIVEELAGQLKSGQELDYDAVKTQLTFAGVQVSLSDVLEMQEIGKDMVSKTLDQKNYFNRAEYAAQISIVQSVANYYGSTKGEIGARFADAINRLADNHWNYLSEIQSTVSAKDEQLNLQFDVINSAKKLFSSLDSSNKETLQSSFDAQMQTFTNLMNSFKDIYTAKWTAQDEETAISWTRYNETLKSVQSFFNYWMTELA